MQAKEDSVKGAAVSRGQVSDGELAARVMGLSGMLQRSIGTALTEKGLGVPQWLVVDALSAADEGRTMSELSSLLGMPAPTVTRIVDGLVDRALVHRTLDGLDRRRVLVAVTERGRSWHGESSARVAQALGPRLDALAGWERETLAALLMKIS